MRISFQLLLTIPFLLQLLIFISLVGFVSDRNSQKSVKEIVEQLNEETSERVYQRIQLYLRTPHLINDLNYRSYKNGEIDLQDSAAVESRLWHQINSFKTANQNDSSQIELNQSVNNVYFGKENGDLHGAEHNTARGRSRLMIMRSDSSTNNFLKLFVVTSAGKATDQSESRNTDPDAKQEKYDARVRKWFKNVEQGDRAAWSEIYGDFTDNSLVITATRAVFGDDGKLIGLFASDLLFSEVDKFLDSLSIGKTGKVFLVHRNGDILVSSDRLSSEKVSSTGQNNAGQGESNLENLYSSNDTSYKAAASCLRGEYEASQTKPIQFLEEIKVDKSAECKSDDGDFFLQVRPISDEHGLDWLMLLIIPKDDVMEQVYVNRKLTLLFLLLSGGLASIIGIITAKQLARPVLKLKEATSLLSESIDQDLPPINVKSPSELEALAESFQAMAERLKTSFLYQRKLSAAYEKFVPKRLAEILEKEIIDIELGDDVEQEGASILFSDIRDFTTISEGMRAEENFKFINAYLSRMEPSITANQGFIDKYIGDAIMAVFPGITKTEEVLEPEDSSSSEYGMASNSDQKSDPQLERKIYRSADDAVKAAISMIQELDNYNRSRHSTGRRQIRIGIGINTSTVRLGTVGGRNRMDGTVISDGVNLASRLESLTKRFGVPLIISENTLNSLEDKEAYHQRFLGSVKVKGRSQSVNVYEVFEGDSNDSIEKKLRSKPLFEDAIRSYQQKDFFRALELFNQSLELCPDDKAAQYYRDRCTTHVQHGVPEDWSGIEQF